MARLNEKTMRPIEVKVAQALCRAQGDFNWKYLRDVARNPSSAYTYYEYLRLGRVAVKTIEKLYAAGKVGKALKEE